ncbi:hypothetical protein [Pseudoalteromonas fuliginea]|uniref:Uncharacterized protein n=1 Tax=Pseudoalteromonas fuliginea TaxID=1872678 RepID=A0ABQ6REZ5_9GAMM|nr:hypothetical protein [Pseudoalteromonas fuliginea]KAA1152088.1 hypothetical protein EU509_14930 [Pseudoalteromonas fuliginea]KAA1166185.1 hypothetical protein EUZ79_14920 [Pseudoalteromonas fuliginea]
MEDIKLTANEISYFAKNAKDKELGEEVQSYLSHRHSSLSEDKAKYDPNEKRPLSEWVTECYEVTMIHPSFAVKK